MQVGPESQCSRTGRRWGTGVTEEEKDNFITNTAPERRARQRVRRNDVSRTAETRQLLDDPGTARLTSWNTQLIFLSPRITDFAPRTSEDGHGFRRLGPGRGGASSSQDHTHCTPEAHRGSRMEEQTRQRLFAAAQESAAMASGGLGHASSSPAQPRHRSQCALYHGEGWRGTD